MQWLTRCTFDPYYPSGSPDVTPITDDMISTQRYKERIRTPQVINQSGFEIVAKQQRVSTEPTSVEAPVSDDEEPTTVPIKPVQEKPSDLLKRYKPIPNPGKGDCLHYAVTQGLELAGYEKITVEQLRKRLSDYASTHKKNMGIDDDAAYEMSKNGVMGGDYEISALKRILGNKIGLYMDYGNSGEWSSHHPENIINIRFTGPISGGHFEALEPIKIDHFPAHTSQPENTQKGPTLRDTINTDLVDYAKVNYRRIGYVRSTIPPEPTILGTNDVKNPDELYRTLSGTQCKGNTNPHALSAGVRTYMNVLAGKIISQLPVTDQYFGSNRWINVLDYHGSARTRKLIVGDNHSIHFWINRPLKTLKDLDRLRLIKQKNLYHCEHDGLCKHFNPDVIFMNDCMYYLTPDQLNDIIISDLNHRSDGRKKEKGARNFQGFRYIYSVMKIFNPDYQADDIRISFSGNEYSQGYWFRAGTSIQYIPNNNESEYEHGYSHPSILGTLYNRDSGRLKTKEGSITFNVLHRVLHGQSHQTVLLLIRDTNHSKTMNAPEIHTYIDVELKPTKNTVVDESNRLVSQNAMPVINHEPYSIEKVDQIAHRDYDVTIVNDFHKGLEFENDGYVLQKCTSCFMNYWAKATSYGKIQNTCPYNWCPKYNHSLCKQSGGPYECKAVRHYEVVRDTYINGAYPHVVALSPQAAADCYNASINVQANRTDKVPKDDIAKQLALLVKNHQKVIVKKGPILSEVSNAQRTSNDIVAEQPEAEVCKLEKPPSAHNQSNETCPQVIIADNKVKQESNALRFYDPCKHTTEGDDLEHSEPGAYFRRENGKDIYYIKIDAYEAAMSVYPIAKTIGFSKHEVLSTITAGPIIISASNYNALFSTTTKWANTLDRDVEPFLSSLLTQAFKMMNGYNKICLIGVVSHILKVVAEIKVASLTMSRCEVPQLIKDLAERKYQVQAPSTPISVLLRSGHIRAAIWRIISWPYRTLNNWLEYKKTQWVGDMSAIKIAEYPQVVITTNN